MRCWRVGIVGGGPGGLMTAYCLQKHATVPYRATILEAGPRLGGKIHTARFDRAPVRYEAGAAELYDYTAVGPDPLRELIAELGLPTTPMDGTRVILSRRTGAWGPGADAALDQFDRRARALMTPRQFYQDDWVVGDGDPIGRASFQCLLDQIPDGAARGFVSAMIHSDLATEPHRTNATYGLHNYLMNDPAYLRLYTIDGGIERLPQELARRISAEVLLNHRVARVEPTASGVRVCATCDGAEVAREFDFVVVALPNPVLPALEWGCPALAAAVRRHHAHYDYPAHYLRVTALFERPFWRGHLTESYFMLDAFGGCCVYDESSRNGSDTHGVLGWLLGGEPALELSRLPDAELVATVLDSLPPELQHGRGSLVEARVHRWERAVNGLPGGYPPRPLDARHLPDPVRHPNLVLVGDYLFDSTLNGVLDSADFAAEWLAAEMGSHAPH